MFLLTFTFTCMFVTAYCCRCEPEYLKARSGRPPWCRTSSDAFIRGWVDHDAGLGLRSAGDVGDAVAEGAAGAGASESTAARPELPEPAEQASGKDGTGQQRWHEKHCRTVGSG